MKVIYTYWFKMIWLKVICGDTSIFLKDVVDDTSRNVNKRNREQINSLQLDKRSGFDDRYRNWLLSGCVDVGVNHQEVLSHSSTSSFILSL